MNEPHFAALRQHLLAEIAAQVAELSERLGRASLDPRVIAALGKVPRHEFVPLELRDYAYLNCPLPIGFEKTISQPFIVALMTDLLDLREDDRVLEIGTGLGYQAAVLAELADQVYSVEMIEELGQPAKKRLAEQGYRNIQVKISNGYYGWPEHAPFDKVIMTAAPDLIPPPLLSQLKPGGKMVAPAGLPDNQNLMLIEKSAQGRIAMTEILPVRFSVLDGMENYPR